MFEAVRGHDAARRGALDRRGVPRRPRARAARRRRRSRSRCGSAPRPRRGRAPDHRRRGARTKFLAKVASAVAKPDGLLVVAARRRARIPPPAARRAAVGRRPRDRREAPRSRAHGRSARSPRSTRRCSSTSSARRPGRHLHALAHNRDPRPVQAGRRRRSIGAQRALGRRPRSFEEIDSSSSPSSTGSLAAADRPKTVPHSRAAAALRRLHACDAVADAASID